MCSTWRIVPLQTRMGCWAGREAFNTDTYHFHVNSALNAGTQVPFRGSWSKEFCWAKGMLQSLWHPWSSLLYLSLPHQVGFFFFLFSICWREQKEQHLLSAAFLHQAVLSVSLGKILQPPIRWKPGGTEAWMLPSGSPGVKHRERSRSIQQPGWASPHLTAAPDCNVTPEHHPNPWDQEGWAPGDTDTPSLGWDWWDLLSLVSGGILSCSNGSAKQHPTKCHGERRRY